MTQFREGTARGTPGGLVPAVVEHEEREREAIEQGESVEANEKARPYTVQSTRTL